MRTYKTALMLCSLESQTIITELVNSQSIKFIFTEETDAFEKELEKCPDAVIICETYVDDCFIETYSGILRKMNTCIIIPAGQNSNATKMIDAGISTFISTNNLKKGLYTFFEHVLSTDTKSEVLIKALRKLRKMADNTNDSIIFINADRTISYINQSALKLLDVERRDVLNCKLNEVFTKHPFCIDKIDCTNRMGFEEYEFETNNGKQFTATGTCSPVIEKLGFIGAVIIMQKMSSEQERRQKELELLKYQQRYHSAQQNLAFQKQMLILKDEMSNIKIQNFAVETYFKPLDILSGDSYGSINLKDGKYLFYIMDAMGKGLSASVTALQSTSFINHSVEFSLLKNDFDMEKMLTSFLYYIRDRLMDEEALCCAFALLDSDAETLTVANYGLPPVYIVDTNGESIMHRPNNLPVMRCVNSKNLEVIPLANVEKILMLSDGLAETETKTGYLYSDFLQDHLKKAFTKKHFLTMVSDIIRKNNDDITFFFIKRVSKERDVTKEYTINTSLEDIFKISVEISEQMQEDGLSEADSSSMEYAISEILMNAFEHGNLRIDFNHKQELIGSGEYDDYIRAHSVPDTENYKKKIHIKYSFQKPKNGNPGALFISISDEGSGFSPANLFKYHTFDGNLCHVDKHSYNGRGIFISDNLLDGLYYNERGNCAYMLKVVEG